jgi:oligoendopeptidase F
MKAYLGPAFELELEDGYFFVNWSHIRRFFYVYSYAYGELVSSALYAQYKKDKTFITKIEQFLSAGSSKSPYQIFKDIGIDTTQPDFFLNGLKEIEKEIKTLKRLVEKKNK